MAEIRCPMCGKPNPDELDVCKFCQARLKPLIIDQPAEEPIIRPLDEPAKKAVEDLEPSAPDWEQSLRQVGAEAEEDGDWLSGFRDQPAELDEETEDEEVWDRSEAGASDVSGEDDSAWLSDMRSGFESMEEEASEEPEKEGASDEGLDWLGRLADDQAELPDWLSVDETRQQFASESRDEALPDWLSEAQVESIYPEIDEEVEELPDDEALQARVAEEPASMQPTEPEPEQPDTPDWLAEEVELPDWFSEVETAAEEPVAFEPAKEVPDWFAQEIPEIPDWLSDQDLQAATTQVEAQKPSDEEPEWLAGLEGTEAPGMIEPVDLQAPAFGDLRAESLDEAAEQAESELDWLSELEAAFPDMPAETAALGEPGEGLPSDVFIPDQEGEDVLADWLSETSLDEVETAELAGEDVVASLMPADLPGWLEAMRPIESVETGEDILDEEGIEFEKAGPLAGLRGVLPAEPDISYITKPSVYTVKLQVAEVHQANADLIEKLIHTEGDARPVPGRPVISPQHVLRIVVAVVLWLAVFLPLLAGVPQMNAPVGMENERFEISTIIMGLSEAAPVLLAVDYNPGLSGEMDAALASVVDHLMIQGAFITLVSTSPTGPVQAERLLNIVDQVSGHQYSTSDQYTNLGFIPGGPVGLLNFADNPRVVLPRTLTQEDPWAKASLLSVDSVADFSLVIVATENPDTARAWIEQVQPRLGVTPLVMVVSAQTEPLVRPYYEASPKQVQAMISGLAGGMVYETGFSRSGNAHAYWSAFSIGMLLAALLIVMAGGINIVSAMLGRGQESTAGEA